MINPPEPPKQDTGSHTNGRILGYNLLAFVVYTVLSALANPQEGLILAFFVSVAHFVFTIIAALVTQRWMWLLAGVLVLIIGFGTCVNNIKLGSMH